MKLAIVCHKDKKAEELLPLFVERNPAIAVRNFSDQCKNDKTIFNKHPEDYSLIIIGEFDTEKKTITSYLYSYKDKDGKEVYVDNSVVLAEATTFVNKEENCEKAQNS